MLLGAMAQWRNGAMAQWRNGAMAAEVATVLSSCASGPPYRLSEVHPTLASYQGTDLDPLKTREVRQPKTGIAEYDAVFGDVKKISIIVEFAVLLAAQLKRPDRKEALAPLVVQLVPLLRELKKKLVLLAPKVAQLVPQAKSTFTGPKLIFLPGVLMELKDTAVGVKQLGERIPKIISGLQTDSGVAVAGNDADEESGKTERPEAGRSAPKRGGGGEAPPCPAGTVRGPGGCTGKALWVGFAQAEKHCAASGLKLPSLDETRAWSESDLAGPGYYGPLATGGAFPRLWTRDAFMHSSMSVWTFDLVRREASGRFKEEHAWAVCVPAPTSVPTAAERSTSPIEAKECLGCD